MISDGTKDRAKKNVRCTSTRKEMERKTENQVERLVIYGKCGVKGGEGTGQDKVEE